MYFDLSDLANRYLPDFFSFLFIEHPGIFQCVFGFIAGRENWLEAAHSTIVVLSESFKHNSTIRQDNKRHPTTTPYAMESNIYKY